MAVTRPTDSLQSKKGCRRRALRRGDCPAGAGHSRGPPATMPTSSRALPVGDARTTMHPWVSKPGTPKSKPETPKSKPAATKSKSGATKSKCLLLPRMEVSQWVECRFRPAGGRCDSTGQATSPFGPFARVVSEKLNHRWGDLARKCRFEVFPKEATVAEQATNAFDRSGRGAARRPMPRLTRRAQDYPASNSSDCGPGPIGEAASFRADSFTSCVATGTPRSARVGASFVRGGSNRLPLPELEPLDLAGRGLGQFGDELDGARVFVGREAVLDETLQLGLVG